MRSLALQVGLGMQRVDDLLTSLGALLYAGWDVRRTDTISASGGLVSSWKDFVHGYDAVAAGSARPAFAGGAMTFDGVANCLTFDAPPWPSAAAPTEMWAVVTQTALPADTATRNIAASGSVYGNSRVIGRTVITTDVAGVPTNFNRVRTRTGSGASSNPYAGTAVDFSGSHVVRAQFGAALTSVNVDGVDEGSIAVVPVTTATRFRLGASAATAATDFWKGDIAMVLVTAPLAEDSAAGLMAYGRGIAGI